MFRLGFTALAASALFLISGPALSAPTTVTTPPSAAAMKQLPRVAILATGGTIEAAIKLVEQLGGEVVKVVFLMELAGLKGRERLKGYDVASVICYDGK